MSSTRRRRALFLERKERLAPRRLSRKRERLVFLATRRAREAASEAEATAAAAAIVVASGKIGPTTKDSRSSRKRTTTRITTPRGDSAVPSVEAEEATGAARASPEKAVSREGVAAEAAAVATDPGPPKSIGAKER